MGPANNFTRSRLRKLIHSTPQEERRKHTLLSPVIKMLLISPTRLVLCETASSQYSNYTRKQKETNDSINQEFVDFVPDYLTRNLSNKYLSSFFLRVYYFFFASNLYLLSH